MRIVFALLTAILLATAAHAAPWTSGVVTKTAWYDAAGQQVEIDHIRYVFVRTARIYHGGQWHAVPDRAHHLVPGTRVRFHKQGFRIYDLEIQGR